MFIPLLELSLEDVIKSTHKSMGETPGSDRTLALVFAVLGLLVLLAVINQRRKQQAVPRAVNHQGKLLKEVTRELPIKSADLKKLKLLAEREGVSSPLTLMLCPSVLARSMQDQKSRQGK